MLPSGKVTQNYYRRCSSSWDRLISTRAAQSVSEAESQQQDTKTTPDAVDTTAPNTVATVPQEHATELSEDDSDNAEPEHSDGDDGNGDNGTDDEEEEREVVEMQC